ncbi:MAG: TfoX/Sxy family protein [Planctomycetes bacterium]|nr:TfoX/Sxy family protein [Planctomycetota bacterium]
MRRRREHDAFTQHVLERLARVASIQPKSMFGGVGFYVEGSFCALIADGRLFFKVDDANRSDFEKAGMEPFQPFPDKPSKLLYFEVPERVLADDARLKTWLDKSLAVARRAAKKKR